MARQVINIGLVPGDKRGDKLRIGGIKINENFAAVPLVSLRMLVGGDHEKAKLAEWKERTNVNGSALATGHANTASGARVIMNLMYELQRRGGGYAMGSLCGGLAQSNACIIKVD